MAISNVIVEGFTLPSPALLTLLQPYELNLLGLLCVITVQISPFRHIVCWDKLIGSRT